MDNTYAGISCAFYTVKQLAALFGRSEDTIRRWKNEGVGREEDNIKLRAVEREDASGRKNSRHLVFSREAVIEFVKANPFLMDDAPQLGMMMQAEGAWNGAAIPMPGAVGEAEEEIPEEESPEEDIFAQRRRSIEELRRQSFGDEGARWQAKQESRRSEIAAEMRRKQKIFLYVTDVLSKFKDGLEAEQGDILSAMEELDSSGMEEKYRLSIKKTMQQRHTELAGEIGMLEEFIGLMEEE